MSEARIPQQADFDLERVMTMLDEALTSRDERVQDALRQLLVIVTLTKTQEDGTMAIERSHGPLRQMQEDIHNLNRRLHNLRDEVTTIRNSLPNPYSNVTSNIWNGGHGGYGATATAQSQSPYTQTK